MTTIIGEIGENHGGNIAVAIHLVHAVAAAGADYAKFQSYRACDFPADDPERQWYERVALSDDDHLAVASACAKAGVAFLSSPATIERARFLIDTMGQREIKVGSAQAKDVDLLRYLASRHIDRVFLSTGRCSMDDVLRAVDVLSTGPAEVVPMHCVSLYPTRASEANLRAIPYMAERLGIPIGYSDHTIGIQACEIATVLGATVIEKHVTLDKAQDGTDHACSVTPGELALLVERIRTLPAMLGDYAKHPVPREGA